MAQDDLEKYKWDNQLTPKSLQQYQKQPLVSNNPPNLYFGQLSNTKEPIGTAVDDV